MCPPQNKPAEPAERKTREVLIKNKMYDVTEFEKRHPGGTILGFFCEKGDASEAYTEFHGYSNKADKVLGSLKSREATQTDLDVRRARDESYPVERSPAQYASLSDDYAKLRQDLKNEGFFDADYQHIVARHAELLVMHLVGLYLFFMGGYARWAGILSLGLASGRCGWLMHEAGHYSLTGTNMDRPIQIFLYGLGCGMSAGWWRSQHNKHHAVPQKLNHDPDLDTLPLVAFHTSVLPKRLAFIGKLWLRVQAVCFLPISTVLVAFFWQLFLHPRYISRSMKYPRKRNEMIGEAAMLTARYVMAVAVARQTELGLAEAIGFYTLYNGLAACYIFTNFSLSHTHLPVTLPEQHVHWVEYAAVHTTNIDAGPARFVSWWMSFLNFQIEHHLFPSMPQYRHPIIAPRVKALFKKHNLHYDSRPYMPTLWTTLQNLHSVGAHALG